MKRRSKMRNRKVNSPAQRSIEPLEARQMLSATTGSSSQSPLADELPDFITAEDRVELSDGRLSVELAAVLEAEIDAAFDARSDLSIFTTEQIDEATHWILRTHDPMTVSDLSDSVGGIIEAFPEIPNTYIMTLDGQNAVSLVSQFSGNTDLRNFYPSIRPDYQPLFTPGLPNDPFIDQQWHLLNTGQEVGNPDNLPVFATEGEDIRVVDAWLRGYDGTGVTIGIVDTGLQTAHPDLAANINTNLDFDYIDLDFDPNPSTLDDNHGTSVAGLAAGIGNNGVGITGVAYNSEIVPIPRNLRWFL